jgi:hypothetical protein
VQSIVSVRGGKQMSKCMYRHQSQTIDYGRLEDICAELGIPSRHCQASFSCIRWPRGSGTEKRHALENGREHDSPTVSVQETSPCPTSVQTRRLQWAELRRGRKAGGKGEGSGHVMRTRSPHILVLSSELPRPPRATTMRLSRTQDTGIIDIIR